MYGCDICQDVCPWNERFAQEIHEPSFAARAINTGGAADIAREVLAMADATYQATYKGSAMKRAKLRGLKRNAAVVLGNHGTSADVELLQRVARDDADEMVREHAAWALARVKSR